MFEAIVSFLFLGSMCLNVVAVIFLVLGLLTGLLGRNFAGQLVGVALYASVVSTVFLVLGGLIMITSAVIGLF